MMHELTGKLYEVRMNALGADKIIREWLEEKVPHLHFKVSEDCYVSKDKVRKVLGLDEKKEWCEHMNGWKPPYDYWKYCMICGKERP